MWQNKPSEHQIREGRAVSAAGLQGLGSHKGSCCSQTSVSHHDLLQVAEGRASLPFSFLPVMGQRISFKTRSSG